MKQTWYAYLLVASSLASCGGRSDVTDPPTRVCTMEARAAISVNIRDSLTNTPAGSGARIIARDGAYADTVRIAGGYDGPYGLAYERAGTYTVTVEQQGYRPWLRSGLTVGRDECHVKPVSVTARLQP